MTKYLETIYNTINRIQRSFFYFLVIFSMVSVLPNLCEAKANYLFSYFMGNGEDGLHLAYSHDGLNWKPLNDGKSLLQPKVGEAQLMRDPCIIEGPDGTFHMVWTVGWWEQSIGIAHSKDLIHWSEQNAIPVMEHEPEAKNCWAPEIFYDQENEQYLIYWATTIPGRFPDSDTHNLENGDLRNHRMYYTTTQDFETYSSTKLFYDPGFNVIDSTIQPTSDGRYVMFLKDETRTPPEKNIKVAFADQAEGPYGEASKPITGDYWAEGPTAIQIGEYWYVYFDKYRKHQYGAVRSKDLKTWEDVSDQVVFPEGTRHGTILEVEDSVLEKLLDLKGE